MEMEGAEVLFAGEVTPVGDTFRLILITDASPNEFEIDFLHSVNNFSIFSN